MGDHQIDRRHGRWTRVLALSTIAGLIAIVTASMPSAHVTIAQGYSGDSGKKGHREHQHRGPLPDPPPAFHALPNVPLPEDLHSEHHRKKKNHSSGQDALAAARAAVSAAVSRMHSSSAAPPALATAVAQQRVRIQAAVNRPLAAAAALAASGPTTVTYGLTATATLLDSGNANELDGSPVTTGPGQPVVLTSGSVRIGNLDPNASFRQFGIAIYKDNAGKPGALVGSGQGTLTANKAWNSLTFPSGSITLQPSTKYWLIYNANSSGGDTNDLYYRDATGGGAYSTDTYLYPSQGFPATFTHPTSTDQQYDIQVTGVISSPSTPTPTTAPTTAPQTDTMKLLVIAADGTEPALGTITQTLSYMGVPYQLYVASKTPGGLTPTFLSNGNQSNYQGVILTSSNLAYNPGTGWTSALSAAEWQNLWNYQAAFGIREISWYTYPTADYGFTGTVGAASPTAANPYLGTFTTSGSPSGATVFGNYANTATPLSIQYAYTYLAQPLTDGSTTPLITDSAGNALAVVHTASTGRQVLALTFDSNPSLTHSLVLDYGLINWVTNGLFLGQRHVYMNPQVDDVFIPDDVWPPTTPCGTPVDQTGVEYRITGADFKAFTAWQSADQQQPTMANYRTTIAFNGAGYSHDNYVDPDFTDIGITSPASDTLSPEVKADQGNFFWELHTWDHPSLNAPTDYTTTVNEITPNNTVAISLGLTYYNPQNMVTPDISGLFNPAAMQGMYDAGIRNIVGDTSYITETNPAPNLGFLDTVGNQPGIWVTPRHPVNLYYNVGTPQQWVAEDNCLYPAGAYGHISTYSGSGSLLDRESSMLLSYLLRGDMDPWMFHQTNMQAYDGTHSLLGDLIDATMAKYNALFTLPVQSLPQDALAKQMQDFTSYVGANAQGSLIRTFNATTGTWKWTSLTLQTQQAATIPVTGLMTSGAETYGGQSISHVSLAAGGSATYTLP